MKIKTVLMMRNRFIYYSATILISFIGGAFAFIFWSYFSNFSDYIKNIDAISLANTYIVFTTIIFVGFSVFLAIAGFIFTHQFSLSKESQIVHLLAEIKTQLKENKQDFAIKFIKVCLDNPDIKNYLNNKFEEKLIQLIEEKQQNFNSLQQAINELSSQIKDQNGDSNV
jgi:hypothetical protein